MSSKDMYGDGHGFRSTWGRKQEMSEHVHSWYAWPDGRSERCSCGEFRDVSETKASDLVEQPFAITNELERLRAETTYLRAQLAAAEARETANALEAMKGRNAAHEAEFRLKIAREALEIARRMLPWIPEIKEALRSLTEGDGK